MSLSIIIPCYNEASRKGYSFRGRITLLLKYMYKFSGIDDFELIFIDDGSNDRTKVEIDELTSICREIKCVSYNKNRGKGYAIKRGILKASKDYVLLMDADLAVDLRYINMFYNHRDDYDCIIGIRNKRHSFISRKVLSILSDFCMHNLLKLPIDDTQCGFKLIKSDIIKRFSLEYQVCFSWLFDAEFLVYVKQNKYALKSITVDWNNSDSTKVKLFGGTLSSCFELLTILSRYRYYKE